MNSHIPGKNILLQNNIKTIPPTQTHHHLTVEQLRLQNQYLKSHINFILAKQAYQNSLGIQNINQPQNQCFSPRNMNQQHHIQSIPLYQASINNHNIISLQGNPINNNQFSQNISQNSTVRHGKSPQNHFCKIENQKVIQNNIPFRSQDIIFLNDSQDKQTKKQSNHLRKNSQLIQIQKQDFNRFASFTPQYSPFKRSQNQNLDSKTSRFDNSSTVSNNFKKRQFTSPSFLKNRTNTMDLEQLNQKKINNTLYCCDQQSKTSIIAKNRPSTQYKKENMYKKQPKMNNIEYLKQQDKKSRRPSIKVSQQKTSRTIQRELKYVLQGTTREHDF